MEKSLVAPRPWGRQFRISDAKEPRQTFPIPMAPERPEEFAPGLDPDLQELADAFTAFKEGMTDKKSSTNGKKHKK